MVYKGLLNINIRTLSPLPGLGRVQAYRILERKNYLFFNRESPGNNKYRKFSRGVFRCQKNAEKVEEKSRNGIPYENLIVGVPKEIWKNEKRYVF